MATKLTKIVADFQTSLAAKISAGGTTGTLISATDDDGVALPAGNYFLTLDGDNSNKEHIVCALSGTALTSIKSVSRQGVQTSGAVREHRVGAKVVLTDFAIIKEIVNLLDGTTDLNAAVPLKYDADPTLTDDKHLATKKYVDGVAVAGAPNASLTVKGIVEEATQAEIDAGTQAGATGAELAVNPKYLKDSIYKTQLPTADEKAALAGTGTPASGNKYVTADDLATKQALDEKLANKDTNVALGTDDTKYPSQKAVKSYVDGLIPAVTWKNNIISRDMTAASGAVATAHGLGRIPRIIKLTAWGNGYGTTFAAGSFDGSTTCCIYNYRLNSDGSNNYGSSATYILWFGEVGGNPHERSQAATITVDATNFTLTWTKTNSPISGMMYILWEAF